MNADQIAHELHMVLHAHGYPYLAPTVERDGVFPRVELFNDRYQELQVVVCYATPEARSEAQIYAKWRAQRMMFENPPCGVVASIATADLKIEEVD